MPFTTAQKARAEQAQWTAAKDCAPQIRLVAGPGTGKSSTIEKRVADLLTNGATPQNIYVISFTRAACAELTQRIQRFCAALPCASAASAVQVSTMHSLALRILRRAKLLTSYPSTPTMLDDWELRNVYDKELATSLGCKPSRAEEIRLAHDASWQTLNPQLINQAQITTTERHGFDTFHAARTHLYSCILPGEVIYRCVRALQLGSLQINQLPAINHLIVDEFQDLNACDQEFVRLLSSNDAILFVAGDDDQSIYSFRHANPDGIVQFSSTYPSSSTHVLTDCFRCAPSVLNAASQLIRHNPNRVPKNLISLYAGATPPVQGRLWVWSFPNARDEARAIAHSCSELVAGGMAGREDEILILITNRRVQLDVLTQELGNLGLPYDPPRDASLVNELESIRSVYTLLRIAKDQATGTEDYPAYRDILGILSGVGYLTAKNVADACIRSNQNFRQLFLLPSVPSWLTGRPASAVQRVMAVVHAVGGWSMADILGSRTADITNVLTSLIFNSGSNAASHIGIWNNLAGVLPSQMTLEELLQFLAADNESDQQSILANVNRRIGSAIQPGLRIQNRIRILTMHGAKGLSGSVVFIPSAEEGIIPSFKALHATGLLIEQRRLFYVSLTRAKACCIISHSAQHSGPSAMALQQRSVVRLTRSQFLNEMGVPSVNRASGLNSMEAASIVTDVNNL